MPMLQKKPVSMKKHIKHPQNCLNGPVAEELAGANKTRWINIRFDKPGMDCLNFRVK